MNDESRTSSDERATKSSIDILTN